MASDVNKRVAANLAAALMRDGSNPATTPQAAVKLYGEVLKLLEDEERGPTLGDDTGTLAGGDASHSR